MAFTGQITPSRTPSARPCTFPWSFERTLGTTRLGRTSMTNLAVLGHVMTRDTFSALGPQDIDALQIALLFEVVGRKSDIGHHDSRKYSPSFILRRARRLASLTLRVAARIAVPKPAALMPWNACTCRQRIGVPSRTSACWSGATTSTYTDATTRKPCRRSRSC